VIQRFRERTGAPLRGDDLVTDAVLATVPALGASLLGTTGRC
jgi:hypothetical protein